MPDRLPSDARRNDRDDRDRAADHAAIDRLTWELLPALIAKLGATGLGELDRAMDYLERAFAERSGAIHGVKGSFLFSALRGHPRFTALLQKMNLSA